MRKSLGAAAAALLLALVASTPTRADAVVTITPIGHPTWTVTDVNLFSAPAEPFGTVAVATVDAILAPHFYVNGSGAIVPVPPDPGPYTNEIARGLARLGIPDKTVFSIQDYAGTPNGIWLAYMLVPGPHSPTGSSPDYASGPIIPEADFPIIASEKVFRDGALFDVSGATTRALSTLGFTVDGSSHRPQFLESDLPTALNPLGLGLTELPGSFEFEVTILDAQGNGYVIVAPFAVAVPEPSSLALLAAGVVGVAGWQRRRKRSV